MVTLYFLFLFYANIAASRFIKTEQASAAPPEVDQINGVKLECSTSRIRASYLPLFWRSQRLNSDLIPEVMFELTKGLNTFTSNNVRLKRPPTESICVDVQSSTFVNCGTSGGKVLSC